MTDMLVEMIVRVGDLEYTVRTEAKLTMNAMSIAAAQCRNVAKRMDSLLVASLPDEEDDGPDWD